MKHLLTKQETPRLKFRKLKPLKETSEIVGQAGLLVRELDGNEELEVAYSILPKVSQARFRHGSVAQMQGFCI